MSQTNVSDNLDWSSPLIGKILWFFKENPRPEVEEAVIDAIPKLVSFEFEDLGLSHHDVELVKVIGPKGWPIVRIHGPNAQRVERRYYGSGRGF